MANDLKPKNYSLDELLYNLLYDYQYRNNFLNDELNELNLSADHLNHIKTIDKEELAATATTIVRNLMSGNIEHNGGLRTSFPGVFQALEFRKTDITLLMHKFLASKHFEGYMELPYAGEGTCIEEAFYNYLSENEEFILAAENNHLLLKHEFLNAIISILTVNKHPFFRIDSDLVKNNGHIYYAYQTYSKEISEALSGKKVAGDSEMVIWLYAATEKNLVRGPIHPSILEMVEIGSSRKISCQQKFNQDQIDWILNLGLIKNDG